MRANATLFPVLMLILLLAGCFKKKIDSQEQAREILSSRNLGLAYLEENKLPEAESEFKKLIELAPKEAMGYANLGIVYMRMGKIQDAEKKINAGLERDPDNADIRLILATLYDISDREDQSLQELKQILSKHPDYIKAMFALADIFSKQSDPQAVLTRESYLKGIVKFAPANLVGRLYLMESFLGHNEYDSALAQLEAIRKEFPEFPGESNNFYNKAVQLLKAGKGMEAVTPAKIFHNFLKLTPAYQSAVQELKGPRGDLIGFPIITMGDVVSGYVSQGGSILESIRFTDVTQVAGLNAIALAGYKARNIAVGDVDNDGDHDLFICTYDGQKKQQAGLLFRNDMGTYTDVTDESGLDTHGNGVSAEFSDYDNDGFVDLFLTTENGIYLFHNDGKGKFSNVTSASGIQSSAASNYEIFVDADHDGDLDILTGNKNTNRFYRNNSDGSFSDQTEYAGLTAANLDTRDAAFADFDDDGDIDLLLGNEESSALLYTNLREGKFQDISVKSGIPSGVHAPAIAAGDYNNDGYPDIFTGTSGSGNAGLYLNNKDGTFSPDKNARSWLSALGKVKCNQAKFFDFDNDGSLDLLVAGEIPDKNEREMFLFHNDGWGKFEDLSRLLPTEIKSARHIAVADFNEDGDFDIYMTDPNGGFHLLRNDGANANHYLRIQLVGVRTGSSKNNYYGIGSKLEIRAGELYQMKIITDPDVLVGLGDHSKADVIRIQWTNGVSQNIFSPASDQDLVEQQELKGSCPFLYSWNGNGFEFVKDIMWKSALGMPMGIMGRNTSYAFPDASEGFILLPGEMLQPRENQLVLQITSELWETIYTDKLNLVAVDHPENVEIYVDEKFTPPPFPPLRIYAVSKERLPVAAMDGFGNNVLPKLAARDFQYVATLIPQKYQGLTEPSELILDPGPVITSDSLFLFLQGWIFPTDASINFALSQSSSVKAVPPCLQVKNKSGKWVTVIDNIGFPMGKDKTVVVDLTGKYLSNDHRIRILTNMEIYWDHAFFATPVHVPVRLTTLSPEFADLHYRGFSFMYRKGGRYGPHWFDYQKVSASPKYLDLSGYYTRYGNVLPLLQKADDEYVISNAGDEMTVKFNFMNLPALDRGNKRDYLVFSEGWVKDGDLNTADGNRVEPLPFHGMKKYPYGHDENYPSDPGHQNYRKEFNTRYVNADGYMNLLSHPRN